VHNVESRCFLFQVSTKGGTTSSIELPNGKYYTFGYNSYGLLSQISYPTGAVVNYTWITTSSPTGLIAFPDNLGNQTGCEYAYYAPMVTQRTVKFDGVHTALVQNFSYTTAYNAGVEQATVQTTVYSSDGSTNRGTFKTVYNYYPFTPTDLSSPDEWNTVASTIPVEQTVYYYDYGQTNLIETVTKGWQDEHLLGCQLETHDGSGLRGTFYSYGSGSVITDEKEYDYSQISSTSQCPQAGEGGPITAPAGQTRETVTTYQSFANTPIFPSGPSILDRPATVKIYLNGANGTLEAETDYSYDQSTVSSVPSATQHDETNYSSSSTAPRGNATTVVKKCLQSAPACSSGNPTTTYSYDETGQITSMKDPNSNTTQYSYADSYTSGTPPGNTNAYLTKVTQPTTNGVAHIESYSYSYADGQLTKSTDQNSEVTTYAYNTPPSGCSYSDGLDRLSQINFPDGGETMYCYNDAPYNSSTPSPSVATTKLGSPSPNVTTLTASDGLGHAVRSVLTSDPDCASGDRTDTTYDGLGHVYTVSNPYCSTSDSTYGLTTYTYDALGRSTQIAHPDGNTILTSYTGRATQVQDEGNGTQRVTRISQSDGLGRLLAVCEVGPSLSAGQNSAASPCNLDIAGTGFLTAYQYDALDDLIQVTQGTMTPRTFAYDSLSRLTSSFNPESNFTQPTPPNSPVTVPTNYSYDANSNLSSKSSPLPNQTGSALLTTSFQYDALNRLTQKSYSDGLSPTITYTYDTNIYGCQNCYLTGRLTEAAGTGWYFIYEYDPMGRLAAKDLAVSGVGGYLYDNYSYDLLGDITVQTAGVGTATYAYNGAARPITVTSSYSNPDNPATVFSTAHYTAFGGITSDSLGDGETESYTYVPKLTRLQSYTATLNSSTIYSFNIGTFAPNGNVLAANDTANGNWGYGYDAFNRLTCSNLTTNGTCAAPTSGTPTYSYTYDRFGNRWNQTGPQTFNAAFTGNDPGAPQNNNRMDGYSYDTAGNLLYDGTHNYTYDAENHILTVDSGNTATYVYDSDGNRMQKTSATGSGGDPAGTSQFTYDQSGRMLQRFTPGLWQGNIYVGSRHLLEDGGATNFSHIDWLGTERVRTTYDGAICESIASLPFGDGQTTTGSCYHSSPLHFTGKERDYESGLDNSEARYMGSSLGRFMSPDPENISAVLNSDDPQAWNGYAYGRNNPLRYTDPEGLNYSVCDVNGKNCADLTDKQYEQYRKDNPDVRATPSGDLYVKNQDGSETKVGSESYYNEKIGESLQQAGRIGQIGVNYAMLVTAPNYLLVGGAHFLLGGSTITTLGITPRFVPWVATSPALAKLINWMYQEGDQLWDGTAGAVRYELATGDPVGGAFHSQKAQDLINGAQNLLKSGTLSAHDQQVARAIIQKLSDALAGH